MNPTLGKDEDRTGDAREVRQVTLVLEPLARRRNLIRRTLAPDPQQAAQFLKLELGTRVGKLFRREVRLERLQELETGRGRRDGERSRRDRLGDRLGKVRGVAGGEAGGGEHLAGGRVELEGLAVRADQLVVPRVERKLAGKGLRGKCLDQW